MGTGQKQTWKAVLRNVWVNPGSNEFNKDKFFNAYMTLS